MGFYARLNIGTHAPVNASIGQLAYSETPIRIGINPDAIYQLLGPAPKDLVCAEIPKRRSSQRDEYGARS